ncbi:MAG: NAD(P)-binding domain-containing protein [Desulfurococcales archaeon]|nr:NAD(P)-binding domain-containing protein [Desulfurococcales archaeon]
MFRVVLHDPAVEKILDPIALIEDIRVTLTSDAAEAPRHGVSLGDTWYASMTSMGLGLITTKMVGVYLRNPTIGLPLVRSISAVYHQDTGEPLILYEANKATAYRTAAATALALQLLGAREGGILGIIGAGVQGRHHGLLLKEVFKPRIVLVASRTREKAESLARELGGRAVERRELLSEADIIVSATTSTTPVVEGALLRPGAIVASVGAPSPVRELDEETGKRGVCLLADTREGVLRESEDYRGFVRVVDLAEALKGEECRAGEVKVYKSVGRSLFDHAVSVQLVRKLFNYDPYKHVKRVEG